MNTSNYWQQSELALASYGTLSIGTILPTSLTGNNVGMSVFQATHFAESWLVVAPTFADSNNWGQTTVNRASVACVVRTIQGFVSCAQRTLRATVPT